MIGRSFFLNNVRVVLEQAQRTASRYKRLRMREQEARRRYRYPYSNAELNHANGTMFSDKHHGSHHDLIRNEAARRRVVEHLDSSGACLKWFCMRQHADTARAP